MGFSNFILSTLFFFLLQGFLINGYDSMDPNGNITIRWDIIQMLDNVYDAKVSIFNYQLYRHVEKPGWRLTWDWANDEIIWKMEGAEAIEQGDCSKFRGGELPHCCKKNPVIIDLLPGTPYNQQTSNCCKGGVLSSISQDPTKYGATFQLHVGNAALEDYVNSKETTNNTVIDLDSMDTTNLMPQNYSLGLPGYTCGPPNIVPPTKYYEDGGRRKTQALLTWNITCVYNQVQASRAPRCCVSLSAFYNDTIIQCPHCSCGCQGLAGVNCVKEGNKETLLQLPHGEDEPVSSVLMCTHHMCPIRVHWHVKTSYKGYWRVKMTITNLNYVRNYSEWSLVVQHPNLRKVVQVFSFNYKPLNQYGSVNDTGMFWGIQYYNEMLLQSGNYGNLQSEVLLEKEEGVFTFRGGFAFPRKISFNGDECVMPPPDEYPWLPNNKYRNAIARPCFSFILFFLTMIFIY